MAIRRVIDRFVGAHDRKRGKGENVSLTVLIYEKFNYADSNAKSNDNASPALHQILSVESDLAM